MNLHQMENVSGKEYTWQVPTLFSFRNRVSILSTVTIWRYLQSQVRVTAQKRYFSLLHDVQNGSGAQPTSYSMGNVGPFIGAKAAGARGWTPISNAKVKNEWRYTSSTLYAFTSCTRIPVSPLPFFEKNYPQLHSVSENNVKNCWLFNGQR